MIGSDWVYCLAGIAGSFLISLLFYWLGGYEKLLFIDMVADNPYGETHNCICMMKNIGRKTITMSDFAPKDQPHFMTDGIETYELITPGKSNINEAKAKKDHNDVYVKFDYLKQGESVFLILKNQKGITGYRATQIDGKPIYYMSMNRRISMITGILSMGSILNIGLLLFCLNASKSLFLFIIGFLSVVFAVSSMVNLWLKSNHDTIIRKLKEL